MTSVISCGMGSMKKSKQRIGLTMGFAKQAVLGNSAIVMDKELCLLRCLSGFFVCDKAA